MDEFLKELTELCKKHNKYIIGSGCEDDITMHINDDWIGSRFYFDVNSKEYKEDEE